MKRARLSRAAGLAAAVLLAFPSCAGRSPIAPTPPAPALVLTKVSGDGQTGPTRRLLRRFLVFRVTDGAGRPVAGEPVEWRVVTGGGQVSGKRNHTDIEGLAAGNFTLGPEPGPQAVRAVVRDSLTVTFTARAVVETEEPPLPAP